MGLVKTRLKTWKQQEDNLSQSESAEYETLLIGGYEIAKEEAISLHDKWKGLVEKTGQREERP